MRYLLKLLTTGAVRKTPSQVIQVLVAEATSNKRSKIVEIGAGGGELTEVLVNRLPESEYEAIEIDKEACLKLRQRFPHLTVHCTSAFTYIQSLPSDSSIDLFVSSIPLSFYSNKEISELLHKIRSCMAPNGKVIVIFTAVWLTRLFKKQFKTATIKRFFTFPPYLIMVYTAD